MDVELPAAVKDGMSGRNVQRKPGTARGWPRRSRTAEASHISRRGVKLRSSSPAYVEALALLSFFQSMPPGAYASVAVRDQTKLMPSLYGPAELFIRRSATA